MLWSCFRGPANEHAGQQPITNLDGAAVADDVDGVNHSAPASPAISLASSLHPVQDSKYLGLSVTQVLALALVSSALPHGRDHCQCACSWR
jgi:hypothetical protein